MKRPLHFVLTGGGTGGHLFPGLAVAEQLAGRLRRLRITFVGSGKEFERRQVAAAGWEYYALPCRPLPRGPREAVSFVMENFAGYLAAKRFTRDEEVALVVGLGGYASVPMGRAAVKCRVPLVLLEQNVLPGRATRWLAPSATLICTSFPQTGLQLRHRSTVRLTGNPIRRAGTAAKLGRRSSANGSGEIRQLLVLGGSGGAGSLNENVPRALYKAAATCVKGTVPFSLTRKLGQSPAGWRIVHQSGEADLSDTAELYRKLGIRAEVSPFLADLPAVLQETDLAVCRAGGTTLAELAAAGVPAVLLPYPHAADDHQRKNADVFVAAGGALLLDERELTGRTDDHLAALLAALAAGPERLAAMSAAMCSLARPDAAANVAALIWSVAASQVPHSRARAAV
jgi:UDP-N-acetylglucosamine--N-acetylmuramyl-(pentapeptide) pyrophosphoryl-undecaprenol N-acetylglucosamine transferase